MPAGKERAVVTALIEAHPYEDPAYDVYERRGDAGLVGRIGTARIGESLASFAERA